MLMMMTRGHRFFISFTTSYNFPEPLVLTPTDADSLLLSAPIEVTKGGMVTSFKVTCTPE
jgi:hypothetical protein